MNTIILRWNPKISSFKLKEHKDFCERINTGTLFYAWSVQEWRKVHPGDAFILLQVGTKNDGIAMIGKFISKAYLAKSWRNDGTMDHYADLQIFYACDLTKMKYFRAEYLEHSFSEINWHSGISGEKIPSKVADKLISRIDFTIKNIPGFEINNFSFFLKNDNRFLPINVEEKKEELLSLLAPYNPIVHVNDGNEDEGDWCFLFDEEEFAIEIKNPNAEAGETRLFIVFEDSVNNEFTLYFAGWHKYYRMINSDYDDFLKTLNDILENRVYVLTAYDKENEGNPAVAELLKKDKTSVEISFWNSVKKYNNN